MKNKILISTSTFGVYDRTPLTQLIKAGFQPVLNPYGRKLLKTELLDLIRDAVGLIAGNDLLTESVLRQAHGLRVISRCGSGLDTVDLRAAQKRGIRVHNTPDAPVESVAELTFAFMLSTLRRITDVHRSLRQKKWTPLTRRLL